MIGVSEATLRRWSDAGDIKVFTTPGGHRRFSRAEVVAMLPADRRQRPGLEQLGETPVRMTRIYRLELRRATRWAPWIASVDESDRELLRDHGDRIAEALLVFLDAKVPAERAAVLAAAEASSRECGRIAGRIGLTTLVMVEAFLRFRMPFLRELSGVARRRGLDTAESTALLQTATEVFDQLLTATIRGYESAVPPQPTQPSTEASDR